MKPELAIAEKRLIFAIDPGPEKSALVVFDDWKIIESHILQNENLLAKLRANAWSEALLALEMIQSFGMPVGASVFETVLWLGRFIEAWGADYRLIYRSTIKAHLCNNVRAKDGNVRQALLDLYDHVANGGGKTPQVGTKKQPGPLYGFKSHKWSALAVAVVAHCTVEVAPE